MGTNTATISTITVDPTTTTTVWAGTACCGGGLYKSVNSGVDWTLMSTGLGSTLIDAVLVDPTTSMTILAATAVGLFRSIDGGATFTAVAGGLPAVRLNAFTVSAGNVFWAAIGNTPYSSADHGVTWTAHTALAGVTTVSSISIDATNGAHVDVGTDGQGVYVTTNTGSTWTAMNTGFYATWVTARWSMPAAAPTSLLLGTSKSGSFRTNNRGVSWSTLSLPQPVTQFVDDPTTSTTLYAIADGVLQKSTDGGAGWAAMTNGLAMGASSIAIAPSS